MKKLYFRFIAYFTTGLFIFLVYFVTLFILLNQLIYPEKSHDLKTPLSYITGYSSLMLNKNHSFSEEERTIFLDNIYKKGVYIEKLIDNLSLTFFIDSSGKILLKHTQVEMVAFLQNLIADVANNPKSKKQIFGFYTDLERLYLAIDETLMYRALYNLLMNCVEHNPDGTKIEICLKQSSEQIYINTTDNGVGINAEKADDIFDKYYSSKNHNTQNKGLGLFIVKQIIDAHGGNISVSSILGKSTSFQIILKQDKI
ncbi:HAMP domain-containing histidine kinase [Clostridioides difficile]|uniref:sensor histidine kinase n=1 Tax=Clostridioides difficile TaxID=1496 RepID=UPI00202FE024|nr:HAMP domain-containing sensor histidine kinase [Clostridioides difficile]MCM0740003.1 HAMP domain-containing histidine kinase [Clostridioides difficile]MCP8337980.1 HAMP domain-containing histidine kinase [Clostridioides difficile]